MDRVTEQQWQQAKAVFSEALEHPRQERDEFVEHACAGNSTLRAEVESLLKSYDEAQSFMETPAIESAAESLVGERRQFEVGQRVKHYEIIKLIGEGGMGEVYLARDTTLGRRIALKMLPGYFRGDQDRLRRFKQEARAASTLSHPNVSVIHEVGETDDGHPFITMEFIDGITLRQRMNDGRLKLSEALDIAAQISDALSAAHEAGIVHRDIKPENVMIRRDGYVKVLDFGLAKFAEHRRRETTSASMSTLVFNSSPGTVMGTAAYMSPEQARGVDVDLRTDIWSLGVVLYEMVAGEAPFTGSTPTDVVIAIVEREQIPLAQQFAGTPPELERIVRKALRKSPEERYQLAKEMAIDLRSLRRDLELDRSLKPGFADSISSHLTGSELRSATGEERALNTDQRKTPQLTTTIPRPRRNIELRVGLIALSLVLILGVGFGVYKLLNRSTSNTVGRRPFEQISVTKLTTNGSALFTAISPDGKYVAYINAIGGKESLWLRQVGSAGNLELIAPREGHYAGLLFSKDGTFIYFGYSPLGSQNWEIYQIPVLGQGSAPVKTTAREGLSSFSHDGKRSSFIRYDPERQTDELIVANSDGSNQQVLATRKWPERLADFRTSPVWSADDQTLNVAILKHDERGYYVCLYEFRLSDRKENVIPLNPQRFEQPYKATLLSDLSGVITSSKAQGASFAQVWFLGRDGSARTITNDLSDYQDADLTADTRALVTIQTQTLSNLWVSRKEDAKQETQITSGAGRYFDLSWAPDEKIIYASDASGSADIYEMTNDGSTVKQLTSGMRRNYSPSVSHDNRFIAFHSNRSGIFQIWRMERDGSNPVQLTHGNSESNWPQFSADSKWIFYQHFESGISGTVWKVPVEGGSPTKVIEGFSIQAVPSPDGKWLACWWNDGQQQTRWGLALISLETGNLVRRFEVPASAYVQWDTKLRWTPDSRNLVYVDQNAGIDNLKAQPIDGGPPKQITNYAQARIFSYSFAKEGRLVTSRGVMTTDVVLISDVTKK